MHVLQHQLKSFSDGGLCILQRVFNSTVEAEGFQVQPDEAEALLIEEDEETRRPLRAGEAVACNQPSTIETSTGPETVFRITNSTNTP